MKFIQDHQRDAVERRILLQLPRQNALGNHLQPGCRTAAALVAHPVANRLARPLAQLFRQPQRHVLGRQAPRLQHHHPARQATAAQNFQRQPGRFAGAGRRVQHHLRGALQGGEQFINHGTDR